MMFLLLLSLIPPKINKNAGHGTIGREWAIKTASTYSQSSLSLYINIYNEIVILLLWICILMATWLCWMKVEEKSNGQKEIPADSENILCEEGQSSESVTNVCNSAGPPQDYESSDTSLKLGWVYHLISVFSLKIIIYFTFFNRSTIEKKGNFYKRF